MNDVGSVNGRFVSLLSPPLLASMEATYAQHRCVEVDTGLLLGSLRATAHVKKLSLTHVLSVFNFVNHVRHVENLHIEIEDEPGANLLEILAVSHAFIEEGLNTPNGRVLVHCFAGMSRSVTVTMAYIMKKHKLSVRETLHRLEGIYPHPHPNPGFLQQLELFQECGYDYAKAAAAMKKRKPRALGAFLSTLISLSDTPRITRYHADEDREPEPVSLEDQSPKNGSDKPCDFTFECRKCHKHLGDSTSVHNVRNVDVLQECGSMFVEQLSWITEQATDGEDSGKLYCPICERKLGSFKWSGISDSGGWYVPGFQLHLNKLDVRSTVSNVEASIHRPKLLDPEKNGCSSVSEKEQMFEFMVFDCDGVLVNTEVASCESLYLCIKDVTGFEIPRSFPEDYYDVFGMDVRSCLEHYKEKFQLDWEELDTLTEKAQVSKEAHYQRLTEMNGISAFGGVVSLIETLTANEIPYGVASSGHPTKIQRNLDASGLIELFQPNRVVSAIEVKRGKPAPDVYLEAFSRIGCRDTPEKCLVIEDSVNGLKAAKAAGAFCVGITNSLPASLLKPYADLVVDHISEIERFFVAARDQ